MRGCTFETQFPPHPKSHVLAKLKIPRSKGNWEKDDNEIWV